MVKKPFFALLIGLVLLTIIVAGCSSQAVDPAVPAGGQADNVGGEIMVERPSEPASPDSYRADSAEHVRATENPQLVEFFAYWCSTCRAMRPTIHELEAEYWGEVDFVYLDIDDAANAEVKDEFRFTAQPLFVLLDEEGNEVQRWFGVVSEQDLRDALDTVVN